MTAPSVTGRAEPRVDEARTTRGGLLVVRVWFEGAPPGDLRARVLSSMQLDAEPQLSAVVRTRAELQVAVNAWLDRWSGDAGQG